METITKSTYTKNRTLENKSTTMEMNYYTILTVEKWASKDTLQMPLLWVELAYRHGEEMKRIACVSNSFCRFRALIGGECAKDGKEEAIDFFRKELHRNGRLVVKQ